LTKNFTESIFSANCPLCKHITDDIQIGKCEGCNQVVYGVPKVDFGLIHGLFIRELNKKSDDTSKLPPFYIVEIRTAPGTDQEKMKNMIFEKTGFLPSITENGTNYVANMRLSLELLKQCANRKKV
jgi:hypothetical protein